jgi:RNA polymerase sigma-70 factor (ECF subfamily)
MTEIDHAKKFVELLNDSRSRLFGFIHSLVLSLDDTEDLYQQVVVVLWQKFDEYRPGTDFSSWAIRVADLTVKNFIRRRRRSKVLFSEEIVQQMIEDQTAAEETKGASRTEALARCLERLPRDDRRLVDLCYGGGKKMREVAEVEGRTPESLYVALHRIRRVLFNCIQRTMRKELGT